MNAWWLTRFTRKPVVKRLATPTGMVEDINGERWGVATRLMDYLERDQTRRSALTYAPTKAIARQGPSGALRRNRSSSSEIPLVI
jgi:hypothetical protein